MADTVAKGTDPPCGQKQAIIESSEFVNRYSLFKSNSKIFLQHGVIPGFELKRLGVPVIFIDARHAKAVLKMQAQIFVVTDPDDARPHPGREPPEIRFFTASVEPPIQKNILTFFAKITV
jgi:hypothetical protein